VATKEFYRLVNHFPPRSADYESTYERYKRKGQGFPPSWTPAHHRMARGLSAYDAPEGAKRQWEESTGHQRFIVRYRLPADRADLYKRTGSRPGHHTLYGGEAELSKYLDPGYNVPLPKR
jgi:hypothetical protein